MRYAGMLTADEGAGHRDHVPGTFAQAAGEVREPVRPVRDVLRDPVALADELGLERVPVSLEHRELKRRRMLLRQRQGALDHPSIVARHREVPGVGEERREVFGVRPVDLRSTAIRALRGLLVGAFHESDSRATPDQPSQVARRPLQVRLQADSNAAVALEEPFAQPNRIIRGRGAFHVEPQDPAIRLRRIEDGQHLGQGVLLLDEDAELGRLDADFAADPLRSHRCEELEILAGRRLHRCLFSVMLSEVVHDRLDAPLVRLLRDADRIVHRFPGDPLAGESQEKTHRSARTPPRTQIDSATAAGKGGTHTGWRHSMQNRTNSGFNRPQLWQRTRISDARTASRSRAVFALPTPVTTPTSRKIHHRRMSQPPIPASTPPMTKRMIAPTKDSKKAVTEKEELVAAPIVPVMKF